MKTKHFVTLVMTAVGTLVFAVGMCMCLLPEWNAFKPGAVLTAAGLVMLLATALVCWIKAGKPVAKVNWKTIGKVSYCVMAALVLGAAMAMIMSFEGMMLPGVAVGVVGIVLLLGIIPVVKGLK